ncbi:MAG: type IV secretory system conjugative DNA transfer family protein, partial [Bacteroidaceae bacterium]|nr:type IV secretory system conjugative DNA transfer family protein [Bacteroidaceae bacterium]
MAYLLNLMRSILTVATLLLLFCLGVRLFIFLRRFGGLKIAHKTKAQGIIFGRIWLTPYVIYSPCTAERHILVLGGSGLGKTSSLLVPTLRAWKDGAFVVDISGDISSNVECVNKLVFEPENPQTIPYDVFAPIDQLSSLDEQDEALAQLGLLLMPPQPSDNAASKYYRDGGRKILTGALQAYYHTGYDFCEICKLIISSSYEDIFYFIKDNYPSARSYTASFNGNDERNIAGCKAECDGAIALFAQNHRLVNSVRRPKAGEESVTPKVLESHKVFIAIDDVKLELYAPLLAIITAQMLQYLSARPNNSKNHVLLALDEFASLGKQDIIPALRKLRKKHVRIMILTQALADIDIIYGHDERKAMLGNLDYKAILSATDSDTQEYLAKLCGKRKTTRRSTTNTGTITDTETDEPAIEPSKLGNLHP